MAELDNNILVLIEPTIRPTDVEVQTAGEDEGLAKQTKAMGMEKPVVYVNGYEFSQEDCKRMVLSVDGKVPSIEVTMTDQKGGFSGTLYPRDGGHITLYIGSKNPDTFKAIHMDFDITGVTSPKVGLPHSRKKFRFSGKAKVPNLESEVCRALEEATSMDHLEEISGELGLGFASNIDATDDAQTRIQPFETTLDFISNIVDTSYVGEEAFQNFYIDQYYNLNFVEFNKIFNAPNPKGDDIQDSYASLDKTTNTAAGTDDNADQLESKLLLTNHPSAERTTNKISQYSLENNSLSISNSNGYKRTLQMYDDLEEERLTEFDIESFTSTNVKDNHGPLKGNLSESTYESHLKHKYIGRQQDVNLEGNVHSNYKYSLLNNYQNLIELDKLKLIVELASFNPGIYRSQKVPVTIYTQEQTDIAAQDTVEDLETEKGMDNSDKAQDNSLREGDADGNKGDSGVAEQRMDNFVSGHYIVGGIEYIYKDGDPSIRQRLTLLRREWPIRANTV